MILYVHAYTVYTIEDFSKILSHAWDFRAKWRYIGVVLDIDVGTLDAIYKDHRECSDCLNQVLLEWVRRSEPKPTWRALEEALQSPEVTGITYSSSRIM